MATARPADSATATVPARSDRHAPLLEIRDLKTWFHTDRGTVRAVDGVDLVVGRNRTLGLVGHFAADLDLRGVEVPDSD